MSNSRPKRAETETGSRRRNYLSAVDAGFRWTAVHRDAEREVRSEDAWRYAGGISSGGFGWAMFRTASRYRNFWQSGGVRGCGIHLTPHGTYFRLNPGSNERHLSGGYLRADGTLGTFDGRHNHPLYCVGCGRADLRVAKSAECTEEFRVPAEMLINIPEYPIRSPATVAQREEREWLQKSRALELEQRAKIKNATEPRLTLVPLPRPAPTRELPARKSGAVEKILLSIAGSLWGTFKLLLLIVLIGLAAGRR